MSVSEKLTSLANNFRNIYGISDKYNLDDMIASFTGLEARNYVDTITPDAYVKWNDGVGSYSHDNSEVINNRDISRIRFKDISNGSYNLILEMKGAGSFDVYVWPINQSSGTQFARVALTDQWRTVNVRFEVTDDASPAAFIRDNSDHEAKNFEVKNWKLVRLK